MSETRIHLFGRLEVSRTPEILSVFPTRKSRSLFAFLVLHPDRLVPREVLANIFWKDRPEGAARKCLRTELWRIRGVLDAVGAGSELLTIQHDSVGFHRSDDVWIDVFDFEDRLMTLAASTAPESRGLEARSLEEAIALYRGDLLEGLYDDWCMEFRERLRGLFLSALGRLMKVHLATGNWPQVCSLGKQILEYDPLDECIHRDLMRANWEMGNRAAALRQFKVCKEVLARELEIDPMPETLDLMQRIKEQWQPGGERMRLPAAPDSPEDVGHSLARLRELESYLGEASVVVRRAIESLQSLGVPQEDRLNGNTSPIASHRCD